MGSTCETQLKTDSNPSSELNNGSWSCEATTLPTAPPRAHHHHHLAPQNDSPQMGLNGLEDEGLYLCLFGMGFFPEFWRHQTDLCLLETDLGSCSKLDIDVFCTEGSQSMSTLERPSVDSLHVGHILNQHFFCMNEYSTTTCIWSRNQADVCPILFCPRTLGSWKNAACL